MQELVSIIIPIYNVSAYLSACLDSVLAQTYSHWEAILINDGSTDNSAEIAQSYVSKDTRFRLYTQENKGLSAARNHGLDKAMGEYIYFLDSDDMLLPDFLETLLRHIANKDVVQCGYQRIDEMGKRLSVHYPYHFYRYASSCLRLYTKSFIDAGHLRFCDGVLYEDILFSLQLWKTAPRYSVVSSCGYLYRKNTQSITSKAHNTAHIYRYIRQEWRNTPYTSKYKWILLYTWCKLKAHFLLY